MKKRPNRCSFLTRAGFRLTPAPFAVLGCVLAGWAAPPAQGVSTPAWESTVPVLEAACFDCHGGKKTKAGVDLKRLQKDPSVPAEYALWNRVMEVLRSGEMPPEDAKKLEPQDRAAVLRWADAALEHAAHENAGDPGVVTLRRLTNAEYDNSIRDLTGIPFGLGRDFVSEGGGGEGFSNIGDALFTSPQQLDKYIGAARKLADCATILPGTGIRFHLQHRGVRGPAQFKSDAEHELVVWYQKTAEPHLPKDDEDLRAGEYLLACWKWKFRERTGASSLEALARAGGLNPAFLQNWWNFLTSEGKPSRYLDVTRLPWRELPAPAPSAPREIPPAVREKITMLQRDLDAWFLPRKWSVLRAQQDSDELRAYDFNADVTGQRAVRLVLGDLGDGNRGDVVVVSNCEITRKGKNENYFEWLRSRLQADREEHRQMVGEPSLSKNQSDAAARIAESENLLAKLGKHPLGLELDPASFVLQAPVVLELPLPSDASHFKARGKLEVRNPDVAFASAQWTATTGTPPDPSRIIPGVITVWKRGTETHARVRGEFAPLHETFSLNLEHRLNQVAMNRFRGGKPGVSVYYFSDDQLQSFISPEQAAHLRAMREDWRFLANRTIPKPLESEWDALVLGHLERFASRAWRRPLSDAEKGQIASIYQSGLLQELDRESAAREVVVRVLVAPAFLYKLEATHGAQEHPVSPWELASRLSFFLWSTIPDKTLLEKAGDGSLTRTDVLKEETLRMLRDPKAAALARQFGAQWFDFQSLESGSKVDTAKFPEFTPELRGDLYEETVAFLTHIIREDRPVLEMLSADYTFLNERLARHYGIPDITGPELRPVRVAPFSRGGLLGMGAILTRTSYPHRTSPVLRGNWVLRNVLGTPTPPPPNDVPKLDESVAAASSLRERLQRHRADRACSVCHDKIDPLGFALESFDPIGRTRREDESGVLIDDSAEDKTGRRIKSARGLREYLTGRSPEFHALFSRKLLGYALGRSILPTDKVLLEDMKRNLENGDPVFSGAVLRIVQSRQFLNRRGD